MKRFIIPIFFVFAMLSACGSSTEKHNDAENPEEVHMHTDDCDQDHAHEAPAGQESFVADDAEEHVHDNDSDHDHDHDSDHDHDHDHPHTH